MKNIFLLVACLFILNTITQAQVAAAPNAPKSTKKLESPEVRAQKSVDKLNSYTSLTTDQKTKVYQFSLTRVKKSDDIRAKYKDKPEMRQARKAEINVVKKEYEQAVKSVLTPAQMDEAKAKRAAEKANNQPK